MPQPRLLRPRLHGYRLRRRLPRGLRENGANISICIHHPRLAQQLDRIRFHHRIALPQTRMSGVQRSPRLRISLHRIRRNVCWHGRKLRSAPFPSVLPFPADPSATIRRSPAVAPLRSALSLTALVCRSLLAPSLHCRWQPTDSPCPLSRIPFRVYPPAILSALPRSSRQLPAFRSAPLRPSIRCSLPPGFPLACACLPPLFFPLEIPP